MKITYLGTGAADWVMKLHKNMAGFRRRSSLLIDDVLLIDPGPDVPDAFETFKKDMNGVRYIINTHPHDDHFNENTVKMFKNARFVETCDGEFYVLGKYVINAYKANHATAPKANHFIITDGEKTLFYGLDGAWLNYEEVAAIKSSAVDYAVFDLTVGDIDGDFRIFEHNNISMVLEMQKTLKPDIKQFAVSHMARTLHGTHAELEARLAPFNIEVAYDGFEREI